MIKPPFTVIILKNLQRPVTIRVTAGNFLVTFGLLCLGVFIIGFTTSYFIFINTKTYSLFSLNSFTPEYKSVQQEHDSIQTKSDINSLSVRNNNDNILLNMRFSSIQEVEKAYIWIIINPDTLSIEETVICPRSPIFKGLPVNYRNGFTYSPSQSSNFSITLSDEIADVDVELFRILVYSSDGKILVDKYFSENKLTRS